MASLLDYVMHYGGQMVMDTLNRRREEKNNQTTVEQLINAAQNELGEEQIRQGLTPFTGQGQGGEMLGWTQPEAGPEALATQRGTPATPQGQMFGLKNYLDILQDREATATQRLQGVERLYKFSKFVTPPGQKIAGKYIRFNPDTGKNEIVTYDESGRERIAGEAPQKEYDPHITMSKEIKNRIYTKKVMPDQVSGLEKNGWFQGEEKTVPREPEPNALVQYWDEKGKPAGFFPNNVPPPPGLTRVPPERPGIVKTRTLNNLYKVQTDILRKYGGGTSSFAQLPGGVFEITTVGKNAYQNMEENARGGNVQAIKDLDLYKSYDAEINKLMSGASATNPNDPLEWRK